MRLEGERESENVEDRRDAGGGPGGIGVAGGTFGRGLGIGGIVALALLALVLGVDPRVILQDGQDGSPPAPTTADQRAEDGLRHFVGQVLASTEDTWTGLFRQMGRTYDDPKLVLYSGAVQSACGIAGSAVGPFYCPGDEKVYLDLSFFQEMRDRFHAPGDFAEAYVVAHEVGHHVQRLLGITQRVDASRRELSRSEGNALSVRVELQADCLAGVWANHANRDRQILEPGDLEEALNAASAIGDDRLQKQSRGYVVPDSFTHGTSQQRVRWFRRGFDQGSVRACNTFGAESL